MIDFENILYYKEISSYEGKPVAVYYCYRENKNIKDESSLVSKFEKLDFPDYFESFEDRGKKYYINLNYFNSITSINYKVIMRKKIETDRTLHSIFIFDIDGKKIKRIFHSNTNRFVLEKTLVNFINNINDRKYKVNSVDNTIIFCKIERK